MKDESASPVAVSTSRRGRPAQDPLAKAQAALEKAQAAVDALTLTALEAVEVVVEPVDVIAEAVAEAPAKPKRAKKAAATGVAEAVDTSEVAA